MKKFVVSIASLLILAACSTIPAVKNFVISATAFAMLAACSAVPQTAEQIQAAAQTQLTATCPTALAEVTTLQSLSASLDQKVNDAVNAAAPIITTMCSPGFVATPQGMAQLLPAVTVIAVQYAEAHK